MTSILNTKIGTSHRVNPVGLTTLSERLLIRPADNDKSTVFAGDNIPWITTSYTITTKDNVQYAATLGKELYAYVLGNEPYTLTVQGVMFNDEERGNTNPVKRSLVSFNRYRASKNKTVTVAVGEVTFTALLEDITLTGSVEQNMDIFTFRLVLRGIRNST